jgi:glycine cleavage system protein P-like pyridoxal-binding family
MTSRNIGDKESRDSALQMANERAKGRYSVEMSRDELYTLKKLCDDQGIDADEALRRAIKTENYMRTKLSQGFKVLVQSPNKQMFEVIFDD